MTKEKILVTDSLGQIEVSQLCFKKSTGERQCCSFRSKKNVWGYRKRRFKLDMSHCLFRRFTKQRSAWSTLVPKKISCRNWPYRFT